MEAPGLYDSGRARVAALVGGLPDDELARPVPATPEWTVKDLVGHLAGAASDLTSGRVDDVCSPASTGRQVQERRTRPLASVLDEWESVAPALEMVMASAPKAVGRRLVCDVACHEHDLRGALERPSARQTDTVDFALQAGIGQVHLRLGRAGSNGLRLVAGSTEWLIGPGDPAATLTVEPFELFRLLYGRRSRPQMAALAWVGDPTGYVEHLALFEPATTDLTE
jgi:uncharacterized protein (TIGR03083 family)